MAVAGLCGLSAALAPGAFASARATTLAVTLTNAKVSVSQASVPAGTVVFNVRNTAAAARTFTVAGKRTAPIPPGRRTIVRVTFGKGGSYVLLSSGARTTAKATLRVIWLPGGAVGAPVGSSTSTGAVATCAHPVSTTVTVTMYDGFFNLSQTSIPCGAVTFVTTNAGHLEHSLVLGSGARPGLNAGETATFTVNLAPGDLHWECGTFGHDDLGEEGTFVVA